MELSVIGSGSSGNCYVLHNESEALIIELGVKWKSVLKEIGFDLSIVSGALVSHIHSDHAKSIPDACNSAIEVYTGQETIDAIDFKSHRLNAIPNQKAVMIGNFKVIAFPLKHDVPCKGFVINHKESGNTVFITDTYFSPWKFANINNWIIECNYSQEIMDGKDGYGASSTFLRNRVMSSHLSLENCLDLFKANDLSKTNNIVLTHLSDRNSNELQFKKAVEDQTLKTVYVANKGLSIPFNKRPF